jgi:hypothetical protein
MESIMEQGNSINNSQVLFQLCQLAWNQFNERRRYEIKISLTFWTALAAATAGSLNLPSLPAIPGGRVSLILAAIFVFLLHIIWCAGIGRAQLADRKIAIFYERQLQKIIKTEFDDELKRLLDNLKKKMGGITNWTYIFQLGLTAFLCIVLVLTNWSRFQ